MPKRVLENVKVSGFQSIRSLDLDLNALNILIGANGSGKWNFISVFKFLNQVINKNFNFLEQSLEAFIQYCISDKSLLTS